MNFHVSQQMAEGGDEREKKRVEAKLKFYNS